MPTGHCLTGRSGHLHNTLWTPRLHQLHLDMATPITRAEVLNLIQSKTSANGAGLSKRSLSQVQQAWTLVARMPREQQGQRQEWQRERNAKGCQVLMEVYAASIWSTSSQASQRKDFNWCASCKCWTTTHATATHAGGKKVQME